MKQLIMVLPVLAFLAGAFQPAVAGGADVVDKMVAAHGGMAAWAGAPSVYFTDEWTIPGAPMKMKSHVHVEQGDRRALLRFPDMDATIGWDGVDAWSTNWTMPNPPRFLALLNYHFLNLPWLVKDPGVVLGEPGTRKLWDDPSEYIAVRVTYEAGVGDTPDDYYVLFIDPDTYELHGCEYVVTYPTLIPEGAESTPTHILVYDTFELVSGLKVPTHFTVYKSDRTEYAACAISDWSFSRPFDRSSVDMPGDAVVDRSLLDVESK